MASLERTAYPRFARVITARDLAQQYAPDENEVGRVSTRSRTGRFGPLVLLKTFQQLHYFPEIGSVPSEIVDHIRSVLRLPPDTGFDYREPRTLFRILVSCKQGCALSSRRWRHWRH